MSCKILVSVILLLASGSAERPSLEVYSLVERRARANATVNAKGRTAVKGGCPLKPPGSWAARVLHCNQLNTPQGTTGNILMCKVDCEGCPDVVLKVTDEGEIFNYEGLPNLQSAAIEAAVAVNMDSGYLVKGFSSRFMYGDGGDQSMCVYLMEEYANEGSLVDVTEKYELSTLAIGHIILDVLRGVRDLHEKWIEHHDIKPENIMIIKEDSGRLRAKLGDFGEACCMGERQCESMVREEDPLHDQQTKKGSDLNRRCHKGRAGYTFAWASPRLVATELDSDGLSKSEPEDDLFTVGKVLYWLFSERTQRKMFTDLEEEIYANQKMHPAELRKLKAALAGADLLNEEEEKSRILCELAKLRATDSPYLSNDQTDLADYYFWDLLTHLLATTGYRVDNVGDITTEDTPPEEEKRITSSIKDLVSKMVKMPRKKPLRARRCEFDVSSPPRPEMPALKVNCAIRKAMDWLEAESGRAIRKGLSEETKQWINYNKEGLTRCSEGGALTRKRMVNQQILDPKEEPEEQLQHLVTNREPKMIKNEQATMKEVPGKTAEEAKKTQEAPKMIKEEPKMIKEEPEMIKEEPKMIKEEPKMVKQEPAPFEKTGGKGGKMKAKEEEATWKPQPEDVEELAKPTSLPPGCIEKLNEGDKPEKSFCEGEEGQKGKAKQVGKS